MKDKQHFQYKSLAHIPKEFRRVDWTYVEVHDKSFAEGEEAFRRLKDELREVFADDPFAKLHFLRAVEGHLLMLAVQKKQPIAKVLECLRRRLDLEYGRYEIYGKAAQAVVIADYVAEAGKPELAKALLTAEKEDLEETALYCRSWLRTIRGRLRKLARGQGGVDGTGASKGTKMKKGRKAK